MKILFVSPVGALFSGAEVAIVHLMRYLSSCGHEVFNVFPDNESNVDQNYIQLMDTANIKYFPLKSMKWWWYESYETEPSEKDATLAYQHKNISEVREIIRRENIDLVISNTVNVFQGAIAAACESVPHYYIIHEFPIGEFGYFQEKIQFIDLLSDKIFAVQGSLYDELTKYFSKDKLYPFIPFTKVGNQELIDSNTLRIVSIGGITERKNQLELLKAYQNLNRNDIELVFIGSWDEDYKSKCDEYLVENQLKNVKFLGYQKKPWEFITTKDIAIFTSKLEAFPLVCVEAILNGVPSIISDNPGHLSVHKYFETGKIYTLGDIESLTRMLQDTIEKFDSEKLSSIAIAQKAREKYSITELNQNILDSIENIDHRNGSYFLKEFSNLFDLSIDEEFLKYIHGQKITVFLGDEKNKFNLSNIRTFPMIKSGQLQIGKFRTKTIRIDLTENPGIFEDVGLISSTTGDKILPISTNGILKNDTYIFYKEDPQIIFDISHYQNDSLILTYTKKSINSLGIELFSQIENLRSKNGELENQLQLITNSKRWRIATRIVNLFRRNK
ncbi:glycosyltransferase family 4 protein [Streptococcus suis]|uniref:glycosyltransferase family 4 protein n=1 Tax=Streptococcus suis TaxID=1307 RepID=UPI003F891627